VPWLDSTSFGSFYALPGDFRIAQSKTYQAGRIYGQDISSGAAVAALLTMEDPSSLAPHQTTHQNKNTCLRILDLCCAPGLKLCAIADWLEQNQTVPQQQQDIKNSTEEEKLSSSVVVGVDLHSERLDVTKNVIHKYHIDPATRGAVGIFSDKDIERLPRIRLYHGDGTTFTSVIRSEENEASEPHHLVFDSKAAWEEQGQGGEGERKKRRNNKSSRARERKRLRLLQEQDREAVFDSGGSGGGSGGGESEASQLFDRVLVDAECSTDGSLKHVQKILQQKGEHTTEKPTTASSSNNGILSFLADKQKMDELVDLQKRLAFNGFRLLRPGGFMVYSTCSLSEQQNEQVVEALLKSHDNAVLVPISMGKSKLIADGSIKGTVRFLPNTGSDEYYGGGFFLAKVQKAPRKST
jgi:16S rRNA C967 or C1407 C5-methylase (RsmB/RsmF family)